IYIGSGKGKTTAAVGLAVRAAGAGMRVAFNQFVKSAKATESGEWPLSSEIAVLKSIKNIHVKVLGKGFVGILGDRKKRAEHRQAAEAGLKLLQKQIKSGRFDLIIADELISALELKLLTLREIRKTIKLAKANLTAFALTGHNKYNDLIKDADLVTEMKMIKHPYYKGILAKAGIDY
ncbi:MAG: cob(I)yrinic acid a,c-diamide adenosyltransferase, partial [Candidatus Doudnabacteria bacterium]|nr:cob(I)yrinic acid a,c-diamide adenosyltransferase [bacterium]MDZ4244180.1 cob(I)yrinic acid a,c-diamide adenosyltransferase [Candidatus Doudnabacteria bacterium]